MQVSGQHVHQSMPKLTSPQEAAAQMSSITVKMTTCFLLCGVRPYGKSKLETTRGNHSQPSYNYDLRGQIKGTAHTFTSDIIRAYCKANIERSI